MLKVCNISSAHSFIGWLLVVISGLSMFFKHYWCAFWWSPHVLPITDQVNSCQAGSGSCSLAIGMRPRSWGRNTVCDFGRGFGLAVSRWVAFSLAIPGKGENGGSNNMGFPKFPMRGGSNNIGISKTPNITSRFVCRFRNMLKQHV